MRRNRTRRETSSGSALILATLSLVVILGMLGMVIDLGWAYYRQQNAQAAADAAALAGAAAAVSNSGATFTCNSSGVVCQAATACPSSIPSPPTENSQNACLYAKANGFTAGATAFGGKQNVTVAANTTFPPPTVAGVTGSYWITVRTTETLPLMFLAIFGQYAGLASARATAIVGSRANAGCLYVLGTTGQTLTFSGGTTFNGTGCNVYVNSSSNPAFNASGSATLNFASVNVVGGLTESGGAKITSSTSSINVGAYSDSGGATITPQPTVVSNLTPAGNPFVNLPTPSYSSSCTYTNYTLSGGSTGSIGPGTYCGGINVSGGANLTLGPGTYTLLGGGLQVSGSATVTGANVLFYDTGNSTYPYGAINLSGGTTVTLSAPSSGPYEGVLFDEDPVEGAGSTNSFSGGNFQNLNGSLYFPTATVNYSGGASNGNVSHTAIVAQTVNFSGGSYFNPNSTPQETGIGLAVVGLVE